MNRTGAFGRLAFWAAAGCGLLTALAAPAERLRLATYNVENYRLDPSQSRPVKSLAGRAAVASSILAIHPDILALEELGGPKDLEDLAQRLAQGGWPMTYHQTVPGWDTNIVMGVLARFPATAAVAHTNEQFLLDGRRFHTARGFGEFHFEPRHGYRLEVWVAHLKSRRQTGEIDEAGLREHEARLLRSLIDARLASDPDLNLALCGDLNDTSDSRPIRLLTGRGARALVDTRPAESADGRAPAPADQGRRITWTHYYAKQETYSRIDYILLSRRLAREWNAAGSFVLAQPGWGAASDHRPVVVELEAGAP